MKSRKLGFLDFGKRKKQQSAKANKRTTVRLGLLESLEKREMMAADWNSAIASLTGDFTSAAARDALVSYINANGGGSSSGGNSGGSGEASMSNISEIEPNNSRRFGQRLTVNQNSWVSVSGSNSNSDIDWYTIDLKGGDILDISVIGGVAAQGIITNLVLTNNDGDELVSTTGMALAAFPATSPLTQSTLNGPNNPFQSALQYIIPSTGTYNLRLSNAGGNYVAAFRSFRSVMEAKPIGSHQTLFLDFNGETVPAEMFGMGPGNFQMAPLSRFVTQFGLSATDTPAFIREITRRTQAKFDQLALDTNNPNFRISVKNSLDDGDLWGDPDVSRVIIGANLTGTIPIAGLLGIAESLDVGNFNTEETSLVFVPSFLPVVQAVPIAGTATVLQLAAEVIARTTAHEAGHTFGIFHQTGSILTNGNVGIMTAGPLATAANRAGAGVDGVFGTIDDSPSRFTNDDFEANGHISQGGQDDSINWIGWSLTSGTLGGSIRGTMYQDQNLNRSLDASDLRLSQVLVYADSNNNSQFDSNEFSTFSGADGTYNLQVPAGTSYTIRTVTPTGFRAVAPLSNSHAVNVPTATSIVTGRDFGYEFILQTATGRKWNDANGNGIRDQSESGVSGVRIFFDLDGDGRLDIGEPQTSTAADGTYTLPRLAAGTYSIREVIEAGWVQTSPGAANNFGHTVVLTGNAVTDSERLRGLDFGNQLVADFGDAPESYGAASAGFVSGLRLGASWDAESAQPFSATSNGDDIAGADDEDGIQLGQPLVRGSSTNLIVAQKVNTSGLSAFLNAWIDFDRDGVFESSEKIVNPETGFLVPASVALGPVNARFRYGLDQNVGPTGFTSGGEVEDYQFVISNSSNIAVDDSDTVPRNGTKTIDVLANDFKLSSTDVLTVIATSGVSRAGGNVVRNPSGTAVIYTAPNGFVGLDTFQYTVQNSFGQTSIATVTIDVSLFFENPVAVDDSFDLPTNSIEFPLNVLANDIEGQNGALTIISITQPDKGGVASIATGGKSLRYTPPRNFGGTEFITYTAIDANGSRTSAKVSLHTLPAARTDDLVQIRLQTVSADTLPSVLNPPSLTQINQGEEFKLRIYIDDLRHDSATNPGSGAGVFAAYFDLLYNLQLVSTVPVNTPGARFNFDVDFLNNYLDFTRGDATVPGLVNEFGATFRSINMQVADELLMAEILFTARSPGVVRFAADPADDLAGDSETFLFNVAESAVPVERIRYLSTELEVFGSDETFPIAVDDTTRKFAINSANNRIDVLRNDTAGSTGSISIVRVQGERGTVTNDGTALRYTPPTNFTGVDQFTYTIQDGRGIQSTANVTVHVGNVAGELTPDSNDIVQLELQITNAAGTPIDQVTVGEEFVLKGFVKDLRTVSPDPDEDVRGVFTVYQDLLYNRLLASPVLSSTNDPNLGFKVAFDRTIYTQVREGDVRTNSLINEIGATSVSLSPDVHLDRRLNVFSVTLKASAAGVAEFFSDPSEVNEVLIFNPAIAVPLDQIHFGFASLNIVNAASGAGEKHNSDKPADVNKDFRVTAQDVLLVISGLNSKRGSGGAGEGEHSDNSLFRDVNADGKLTAMDALEVIKEINRQRSSRLGGEGEFVAAPEVKSSGTELVGEGENTSSDLNLHPVVGKSVCEPIVAAQYSLLADTIFDSEEEDELESVLDEMVGDIDLSWNQNLLS